MSTYESNSKLLKHTMEIHGVKSTIAALPEDIMILIIKKLDTVDFHCFSIACRSWQSMAMVAKGIPGFQLRSQLPWLMLSSLEDHRHSGFFSFLHGKVYKFELPRMYGSRCVGCNWGWLIMVDNMRRVFLLNPFSRVQIELPLEATFPVPDLNPQFVLFPEYYSETKKAHIRKALLFSIPAADTANKSIVSSVAVNNCVVIAIHHKNLAFCRPGDEKWSPVEPMEPNVGWTSFEDIIFYNGKLYAITRQLGLNKLLMIGFRPRVRSCHIFPPLEVDPDRVNSVYLVECLGELLMVLEYHKFDSGFLVSVTFQILKLDLKGETWIMVEDLGDQMLFINKINSTSVSIHDYPEYKGNCICFTPPVHCNHEFKETFRLFHLEDNSIEPFISIEGASLFPHVWFTPASQ